MALLVGRHLNKIDKKGRVSVPKPYREAVTSEGFAGVYIFPYFKYPALEGAGEAFMQRLSASLDDNLELFSDAQESLAAITLENTFQLAFDPEGRISLPTELCQHAGLDGQALFVGHGSRFQIWSPDTYQEHRGGALEKAKAEGATLQLSPRNPTGGE
ncbi:division/cell wall cluster transcriptional repressor MraZ [Magnetovibrio sp.]|uniref:division/cell wall cluster transcriptional repressor MraZ n=1 Tax=Magnetovibrio sp. TaxID=2024836 RepID=UPI002F94DD02